MGCQVSESDKHGERVVVCGAAPAGSGVAVTLNGLPFFLTGQQAVYLAHALIESAPLETDHPA